MRSELPKRHEDMDLCEAALRKRRGEDLARDRVVTAQNQRPAAAEWRIWLPVGARIGERSLTAVYSTFAAWPVAGGGPGGGSRGGGIGGSGVGLEPGGGSRGASAGGRGICAMFALWLWSELQAEPRPGSEGYGLLRRPLPSRYRLFKSWASTTTTRPAV